MCLQLSEPIDLNDDLLAATNMPPDESSLIKKTTVKANDETIWSLGTHIPTSNDQKVENQSDKEVPESKLRKSRRVSVRDRNNNIEVKRSASMPIISKDDDKVIVLYYYTQKYSAGG
jgi:hypothetical protein